MIWRLFFWYAVYEVEAGAAGVGAGAAGATGDVLKRGDMAALGGEVAA